VSVNADRRYLTVALMLLVGFMAGEVAVGILASSLALLADAAHMVSDAGAIALAMVAMRLAARPIAGSYTYGFKRAEILSALANGLTLLLLAGYFIVEGLRRLVHPPDVEGALVLAVALVGVAVNITATLTLRRANRQSLNIQGAFQHILNDLYAFLGTAIAGLVIVATGFTRADPIASLAVAALMAHAGYRLVRESTRVFLEAAPRGVDPTAIDRALHAHPSVVDVHDLHIWEVTSGFPALSAHILVAPREDCHARRLEIERLLHHDYGLNHVTLQVDHHPAVLTLHREAPHPTGDHAMISRNSCR
jgi:cobalt-zinc-cadmium efflux system protein